MTGSTTTDARDTVSAALPAGLAPQQALVNGARELTRRGVRLLWAVCQPGRTASVEGITTIPAGAQGVRSWPADVMLTVSWSGTEPVTGPNLRLALSVARGAPQTISPPSATPAPSNCPPGLPLGTPAS